MPPQTATSVSNRQRRRSSSSNCWRRASGMANEPFMGESRAGSSSDHTGEFSRCPIHREEENNGCAAPPFAPEPEAFFDRLWLGKKGDLLHDGIEIRNPSR